MTRKIPTRKEPTSAATNYARKAQEFFDSMLEAATRHRWNAAASLAIHAVISITDAVLTRHWGERSISKKHGDTAHLLATRLGTKEAHNYAVKLGQLLSKKSLAEYDNRMITPREAGELMREAERYYLWAKSLL